MATLGLVEIVVTLESVYLIQITHVQQMKIVNASMDIIISPKCFKSGPVHSGRNQGFFVQWVYWVYLFIQNTRPLCNAAMYEQV